MTTTWERIAGPAFAALLLLAGILTALIEAPGLAADAMVRLREPQR